MTKNVYKIFCKTIESKSKIVKYHFEYDFFYKKLILKFKYSYFYGNSGTHNIYYDFEEGIFKSYIDNIHNVYINDMNRKLIVLKRKNKLKSLC